ncbi:MAG: hypothetical protein WC761_04830 [Candidatus Paceibacterota bacterium]
MQSIITRTRGKIKTFFGTYSAEVGVSLIIIFVAISSFYLGKISVSVQAEHPPITIEEAKAGEVKGVTTSASQTDGAGVVATKNGKRWYLPWCPSVAKLAESAKRHFASVAEAEAAGLTPAKNCAGMNVK